jgi:hypothetical protein
VLALAGSNALAAGTLAPMQVFTDGANDHELWGDPTPPPFDLVGGSIAETKETIDFIWQYADIPDGSGGLFEGNISYWEFAIDDADGVTDPVQYSLRARANYPAGAGVHVHCQLPLPVFGNCAGVGPGGGQLQGNCTTANNIISCQTVPGSLVTVSVDDVANTITAKVRRLDLRDTEGNFIATDGAVLSEVEIFQGIASCQGAVLISGNNCDIADMNVNEDGSYVLGSPR